MYHISLTFNNCLKPMLQLNIEIWQCNLSCLVYKYPQQGLCSVRLMLKITITGCKRRIVTYWGHVFLQVFQPLGIPRWLPLLSVHALCIGTQDSIVFSNQIPYFHIHYIIHLYKALFQIPNAGYLFPDVQLLYSKYSTVSCTATCTAVDTDVRIKTWLTHKKSLSSTFSFHKSYQLWVRYIVLNNLSIISRDSAKKWGHNFIMQVYYKCGYSEHWSIFLHLPMISQGIKFTQSSSWMPMRLQRVLK